MAMWRVSPKQPNRAITWAVEFAAYLDKRRHASDIWAIGAGASLRPDNPGAGSGRDH
jgi:hypothetical protein